jgi:outer membrane protein with beta-barrel domain
MRTRLTLFILAFSLVVGAAPASAQRRTRAQRAPARASMPAAGTWAVGGSLGVSLPADPSLDTGLDVAGTIEGYLTPRVSVRGQLGGAWWDITGRHFTGTVKPLYLDGNVVYNWEGGALHPYVTAGVGMYKYRSTESGVVDGSDTKAGFNLGGGLEYFFTRDATVTGEALYHKVGAFNTPLAVFTDGSFWSLSIGLKKYF